MKNNTKRIAAALSALTLFCGMTPVQPFYEVISRYAVTANAANESDFEFIKEYGRITKYLGKDKNVVIPSQIGGVNVKNIGYQAFQYCDTVETVILPDTVTIIGNSAFEGCTSLKEIKIPEGIASIGNKTFFSCESLEKVTLPSTVESIGNSAFWGCTSLKSINIPEGVTSIEDSAFLNCSSLEEITLPSTVSGISYAVFEYCKSLKEIKEKLSGIGLSFKEFE